MISWADAIVIASPTPYHCDDLRDAITAGKHVLVEKPIGCDQRQATEIMYLLRQAQERDLVVMVGTNLRFHECVKQAKSWIDSGCLGRNLWANFTCAQKSDRAEYLRDGVTSNWGAHEIDLALYLLGSAKVTGASINQDDSISDIILLHDSGFRTTIHLDYHTEPEIRTCTIVGDYRSIRLNLVERNSYLFKGRSVEGGNNHDGDWDSDYLAEMKAFIGRIEGKGTLGATGEEGLAALDIILEAKRLSHATAAMHSVPAQGRGKKVEISQSS
jgi:predicted dehydrogenase